MSPSTGRADGRGFLVIFLCFFKKMIKTSFRQIYRLRGAYFRDPRNGVSIDARQALRKTYYG